ncbi:hypothetical protein BN873_490079 [Candidatus Competibacter denitrificans Run_A_D11]|uniref:Uncharacterized protein n=1 Tax=Candidatus Competibacter denitrificans Run_A_D11 TaxID=1400863 RepID=W6MBF9_9GAMM|nr:hypothetical protein BN873_490079 [Candidatus Competibacter denitrificans Run_A_D11]
MVLIAIALRLWLSAAANDFFAGALGNEHPGIPLTVLVGLTGARMSIGFAVILARLNDAVTLLGIFIIGGDCLTGIGDQTKGENAGQGGIDEGFAIHTM